MTRAKGKARQRSRFLSGSAGGDPRGQVHKARVKVKLGRRRRLRTSGAGFWEHEGFRAPWTCIAPSQENTGPMPEAPPPDQAGDPESVLRRLGVV